MIGFLRNTDAASSEPLVSAFRQGLAGMGYVEGDNLTIEYRWADNHEERLPALAADLAGRGVSLIAAGGGSVVALAAKAATRTIPVVFELGGDPVRLGLVPSLNRPEGNLTGVALFSNGVGAKRIGMLCELVPKAKAIGLLIDPGNPNAASEIQQAESASHSLGVRIVVLEAHAGSDIAAAFAQLRHSGAGALAVMATPLFVSQRDRLVELAARDAVAAIYPFPSFAKAGGLMSYGDDLADAFRQLGIYVARILKGAKPSELPVIRPTKFALVINRTTANALGIVIPPALLALADEVIE